LLDSPPDQFKYGQWLTIDPGDNTAVCSWKNGAYVDIITFRNCLSELPCLLFSSFFSIIIENVNLWGGSSVSYASAASGDLFKLAMLIGALIQKFRSKGFSVYLVNPVKWKGQLNQTQLQNILLKKFHITVNNEHEVSAIGIGLWAKGLF